MGKMYIRGMEHVLPEGFVSVLPIDAMRRLAQRRMDLTSSRKGYSESLREYWEPLMRQKFWIFAPYWTSSRAPSEFDIQRFIDKNFKGTFSTTPRDVNRSFASYVDALVELENLFKTVHNNQASTAPMMINSRLFMFLYSEEYHYDLSGFRPLHV